MIETMNKFVVGARGDRIVILNFPPSPMTAEDALLLAAWLVSIADPHSHNDFADVLAAVQGT